MYFSHEKIDDIRNKFPKLNEWINNYMFNKKSRRHTILDYKVCTGYHEGGEEIENYNFEGTEDKPKPEKKKYTSNELKFMLQNELIYQLSEVKKQNIKKPDQSQFWMAIKQIFMDKQNQLMKARIKQNMLTSDMDVYRDIDTEIQKKDVDQWKNVCEEIKKNIGD